MQQFTVVPENTRIFKSQVSDLKVSLPNAPDHHSHVFLRCSFDNFRTWDTPACPELARDSQWKDWEINFMYETEHWKLLLFKLFRLSVYCHDWNADKKDHFLGEAKVDLLSLAAGPEEVILTIYNGDDEVGHVGFNMIFREESEVRVRCPAARIHIPNEPMENLQLEIRKRGGGADQARYTPKPSVVNTQMEVAEFDDVQEHYFGVSVTRFLEDCGYDVVIYEPKALGKKTIGTASILFSAFMKDSEITKELDVRVPIQDADGTAQIGEMTARFFFDGIPLFVQMYGGKNINGKIFDGQTIPGKHPMPLNIAEGGIQKVEVV